MVYCNVTLQLLPCTKWEITIEQIEILVSRYHITQENYKLDF